MTVDELKELDEFLKAAKAEAKEIRLYIASTAVFLENCRKFRRGY